MNLGSDGDTPADLPVVDLSENGLLTRMDALQTNRRTAEVGELEVAVAWAYAHGHERRPREPMTSPGGDGTPAMRQCAIAELALARGTHALTARCLVADGLDLIHRLPKTWAVVHAGRCDSWIARRVAIMTRHLPLQAVADVDGPVAAALAGGEAPLTVFELTAACIIKADPDLHNERLEQEQQRRAGGVGYVSLSESDEHGYRRIIASVQAGDAAMLDALVDRVADILAEKNPALVDADEETDGDATRRHFRDRLRAEAMGWLTRPADLLKLLLDHSRVAESCAPAQSTPDPDHMSAEPVATAEPYEVPDEDDPWPADEPEFTLIDADGGSRQARSTDADEPDFTSVEPDETTRPTWLPEHTNLTLERLAALSARRLASLRGSTTLFVHTTQEALETGTGLARVEGGGVAGGPHWITSLTALLGHSQITLKPVIDLNNSPPPATAYEHSERLKDQVWLTCGGDVFPYSTRRATRAQVEFDHTVPFDPNGPPGQTGTHNSGPLMRRHHRWKTHDGYKCHLMPSPAGPRFLWQTPTGRYYLRDRHGTEALSPDIAKLMITAMPGIEIYC